MTRRRLLELGVVAVAIGLLATYLVGPRPLVLAQPATGDQKLAEDLRRALPERGYRQVAVAVIDGQEVTYAGFGADEHTAFEIGSVTKALTGMLLAAEAEAGRVHLDQRADELLPELPANSATLAELSQHRSGLPRIPRTPGFVARGLLANVTGGDPYDENPGQVLALAAKAGLPGGAKPAYSNLGASVLGHALGAADETSYPGALRRRIVDPLGMDQTRVVSDPGQLPAGRARGRSGATAADRDPWIASGWAPAGSGVWSTTGDLARLGTAVLARRAPGMAAVEPTAPFTNGARIGLGWIVSEVEGRTLTWHNGGTGGFTSYLGLDRSAGRAVVVLSASDRSVDDVGERLLLEGAAR